MPIIKKITRFLKDIFIPEKIIDPSRHHKEHETFYKIAKDLQKEHNLTKKEAIKLAKEKLEARKTIQDLRDKGLSKKDAEKTAKKILKVKKVKISPRDENIIQAHSPTP